MGQRGEQSSCRSPNHQSGEPGQGVRSWGCRATGGRGSCDLGSHRSAGAVHPRTGPQWEAASGWRGAAVLSWRQRGGGWAWAGLGVSAGPRAGKWPSIHSHRLPYQPLASTHEPWATRSLADPIQPPPAPLPSSSPPPGTHIGRIKIVLFKNEAPRAAENFRALCTGAGGRADLGVPRRDVGPAGRHARAAFRGYGTGTPFLKRRVGLSMRVVVGVLGRRSCVV